jgi:hypothetical protein
MKIIQRSPVRNSFLDGLCKLFDGMVEVLSLGTLSSSLAISYCERWTKRKIRKMR